MIYKVRAFDDGWRMFYAREANKYVYVLEVGPLREYKLTLNQYKDWAPKVVGEVSREDAKRLVARSKYWREKEIPHDATAVADLARRMEG